MLIPHLAQHRDLGHVEHVEVELDHVREGRALGFQCAPQILEHLARLRAEVAGSHQRAGRIEGDLSGHEEQTVARRNLHDLGVAPARRQRRGIDEARGGGALLRAGGHRGTAGQSGDHEQTLAHATHGNSPGWSLAAGTDRAGRDAAGGVSIPLKVAAYDRSRSRSRTRRSSSRCRIAGSPSSCSPIPTASLPPTRSPQASSRDHLGPGPFSTHSLRSLCDCALRSYCTFKS